MKAFPTTYRNYDESISHDCTGMDLRDYFAAKAMPMSFKFAKKCMENDGIIFEISDIERENEISAEIAVVAEYCYIFADAMLEARKK